MKIKIVEFGVVYSDGDIFEKESIILPSDGHAYVTKVFNKSKVIGNSQLSIDDDGVYADIKFAKTVLGQEVENLFSKSFYPSIEFLRVGDKIQIYSVGLCEMETH